MTDDDFAKLTAQIDRWIAGVAVGLRILAGIAVVQVLVIIWLFTL